MKPINLKFKGLGSYFNENEIDFSALDSIFLICGETGAGKTTILDAMMFALYGESSGGERNSLLNAHYSKADGEAYTIFTFELSGRLYRFSRMFTPKARAAGYELSRNCEYYDTSDNMWLPFFDNPRITDLNDKATELLGLTAEQFRQVVILPQGKFERLLTSPSAEKEKILTTLFGADRFTQITDNLKKQADEDKKAIEQKKIELNAVLQAAGFETIDDAQKAETELNERLAQLKNDFEKAAADKKSAEAESNAGAVLASRFGALDRAVADVSILSKKAADNDTLAAEIERLKREKNVLEFVKNLRQAKLEADKRASENQAAKATFEKAQEDYEYALNLEVQHKSQEKKHLEQSSELIRLDSLKEVYKSAEPLKNEAEISLKKGKALRKAYDDINIKISDLKKKIEKNQHLCEHIEKEYSQQIFVYFERLKALENAEKLSAELQENLLESKHFENSVAEKKTQLAIVEQQELSAKSDYENARKKFTENVCARLAAELSDGIPCPVCHSTHHPDLKHNTDLTNDKIDSSNELEAFAKALDETTAQKNQLTVEISGQTQKKNELDRKAQLLVKEISQADFSPEALLDTKSKYQQARSESEKLESLNNEIRTDRAALERLSNDLSQVGEELTNERIIYGQKSEKYKDACERMDKNIPDALALNKKMNELSKLCTDYEATLLKLSENKINCAKSLAGADNAYKNAQKELTSAQENYDNALKKLSEELVKNHLPTADKFVVNEQEILTLDEKIHAHEKFISDFENAKKNLNELENELQGKQRPNTEDIKKRLDEAAEKYNSLDFQIRQGSENSLRINRLCENYSKKSEEISREYNIYIERNEFAAMMSGAKGISFTRYVLGVMLDLVTDEANRMLSTMLGGAFRLARSKNLKANSKQGLDLAVENTLSDNSAQYCTAQLSGGEKFLLSLVLGVSLSTVVQSRFGGISIDAVFIDEGFGSLDPSSLADAVNVIYAVKGSRRTVGIISHVEKLREEIPCCINVHKTRNGSQIHI